MGPGSSSRLKTLEKVKYELGFPPLLAGFDVLLTLRIFITSQKLLGVKCILCWMLYRGLRLSFHVVRGTDLWYWRSVCMCAIDVLVFMSARWLCWGMVVVVVAVVVVLEEVVAFVVLVMASAVAAAAAATDHLYFKCVYVCCWHSFRMAATYRNEIAGSTLLLVRTALWEVYRIQSLN